MAGEIQRAQLFADVDELLAWKKAFNLKQAELIAWQAMVMNAIQEMQSAGKTTLEGCGILMETDTVLGDRIDDAWARIDIVNKRLRKLENPE
jgi:hypothetical protein